MPKTIVSTLYKKVRGSWMLAAIMVASLITCILLDTALQNLLIVGLTDPTQFSIHEWARIVFRLILSWTIAIAAWLGVLLPALLLAPLFRR